MRRARPIRQWQPLYQKRCTIRGYFPLLTWLHDYAWQEQKPQYWAWPGSKGGATQKFGRMGGMYDMSKVSFQDFYTQHQVRRNRWSASNETFDLAKYRGVTITLYRHLTQDYIFSYTRDLTEMPNERYLMHPSVMLLLKNHIIVKSQKWGHRKPIRVRIKPGPLYEQKWYLAKDLAKMDLFKYYVSAIDLSDPFVGFQGKGDLYVIFTKVAKIEAGGSGSAKWQSDFVYYPVQDTGQDRFGNKFKFFFASNTATYTGWDTNGPPNNDTSWKQFTALNGTEGLPLWLGAWNIYPSLMTSASETGLNNYPYPRLYACYRQPGSNNMIIIWLQLCTQPYEVPSAWWFDGDVMRLRMMGPWVPGNFTYNHSIVASYKAHFTWGGNIPGKDNTVVDPSKQPPETSLLLSGLQGSNIANPALGDPSLIHTWDLRRGLLTNRALKRITEPFTPSSSDPEEEAQNPQEGPRLFGSTVPRFIYKEHGGGEKRPREDDSGSSSGSETETDDPELLERRRERQLQYVHRVVKRLKKWSHTQPHRLTEATPPTAPTVLPWNRLLRGPEAYYGAHV